jgi:hypothetical protein
MVVFFGVVVSATAQEETFTGCLAPGGNLRSVAIGDAPMTECQGSSVEVSWNVQGPAGPTGPAGADGHLTCDDERRINAAVPTFEIREECGLIVVATGLGEDGSASTSGSSFVESAPFGNPPGDHDVAYRFEVVSSVNVSLEYIDLAVTARGSGSGPLDIYLVNEQPAPQNQNLSSEPDMLSILEQWQRTPQQLLIHGARLPSTMGPELAAGERYWLVLSVTEPASRYQWFSGVVDAMPGNARAERYDFTVSDQPPGTWIGADATGGSPGLRVVGLPITG